MSMYEGPNRKYPIWGYIVSYSFAAFIVISLVISGIRALWPTREEASTSTNYSPPIDQSTNISENEFGVASDDNEVVPTDIETVTKLVKSERRDSKLQKTVFPLNYSFVSSSKTDITIIGAEFGNDQAVGNGIMYEDVGDDVSETVARSFARGVKKGFSDEAEKRDASFALYIKATPYDAKSPREVGKFDPNIRITDDKGDNGILLYDSFSEEYLTINKETYGVFIFAVYSDSKTFNISFDDTRFSLTGLPYIKAKE